MIGFETLDESLSKGVSQAIGMQSGILGLSNYFERETIPLAAIANQYASQMAPLAAISKQIALAAAPMVALQNAAKDLGKIAGIPPTYSMASDAFLRAIGKPALPGIMHGSDFAKMLSSVASSPPMIQSAAQILTTPWPYVRKAPPLPSVRHEVLPTSLRPSTLIKQPRQAPQPATVVTESDLLPTEVMQSQLFFVRLIAQLKKLPASDVIDVLDWHLEQREGLEQERFLNRLTHYLEDGKDFSSTCWPLIKFWLDSIRGKAPEPTWYSAVGTDARPAPADEQSAGHFAPLLLNYSISQLRGLLRELGLLTYAGQAAPAASPGAWVGIIYGLLDAKPARLRGSKAAIRRAFCETFGARVSERAVQVGLGTNGSEAERFHDSTLALLRERASAE